MNHRLVAGLQCRRLSYLGLSIVFVLLFAESESSSKYDRENWVNPDDMINYDRASKTMIRTKENNRESPDPPASVSKDCTDDSLERELKERLSSCEKTLSNVLEEREGGGKEGSCGVGGGAMDHQYTRRFVNVLLRAAGLADSPTDKGTQESTVSVRVSAEHLSTLRRFGEGGAGVPPLTEVDDVLTQVLTGPDLGFGDAVGWLERLGRAFPSRDALYRLLPYAITLATLAMLVMRRPVLEIGGTFLVLVLALSYQCTYDYMLKMAEVRQYVTLQRHERLPDSCRARTDWSLYEYLLHRLTHDADECGRYHAAQTVDAALEVSPTLVLSEMLSAMVLHPAAGLGEGVARYSAAVLGGLPMFWNWVVLILSFAVFALVAVLAVVLVCGGRLRLPYLFSGLEITGGRSTRPAVAEGTRVPVQEIRPPANQNPLVGAFSNSGSEGLVLMNMPILERLMSAREDRAATTQRQQHRDYVQRLAPAGAGGDTAGACCPQCRGGEEGDSETRVAMVDASRDVTGRGSSDRRVATVDTLCNVTGGRGGSDTRVATVHTSHDLMGGRADFDSSVTTGPEVTGGRRDSHRKVTTVDTLRELTGGRGESGRKNAVVPEIMGGSGDSDARVATVHTLSDLTGGTSASETRIATVDTLCDVAGGGGDSGRHVPAVKPERASKGDRRLAGGDFARGVVSHVGVGEDAPPLSPAAGDARRPCAPVPTVGNDADPLERSGFIDELRKILDESDTPVEGERGDSEAKEVEGPTSEGRPDFVDTLANLLEECSGPGNLLGQSNAAGTNCGSDDSGAELIRKVSSDSSDASGDFVKL